MTQQKQKQLQTGKKFTEKNLIEPNIKQLYKKEIINGTGHLIILVIGGSNTGKTSLSLLIQQYLNKGKVQTENIALDHSEFKEIYTTKKTEKQEAPKKKIVYEEGRDSFFRTNATTKKNKEAKNILYKYRAFQNTCIINFQNARDLAPFLIINEVADAVFRCTRPGKVEAYGQQTIKEMWERNRNRRFKGWHCRSPDFVDYFEKPEKLIPEEWEEYRKSNINKLDQSTEKNTDKSKTLVQKLNESSIDFELSEKRLKILKKLENSKDKELATDDFLDLYSTRSSVMRSMRGLRSKGLIEKNTFGKKENTYKLTSKGEALIELL